MELRDQIVATARALGMSPVDLATIISYETGGTFDPLQPGPTTKWGQHRGLIQFGEPQAKQHGVDWNDPAGSQLGPDGAIVRYFRSSGWQPGMGLLDAYSIVNAGAPGRYNASDTAAGGAPGTVRDKVEGQFAPHRAKATALLGGEWAAPPSRGGAPKPSASGRPAGGSAPPAPDAPTSVARLLGAEKPAPMAILAALGEQTTQQTAPPPDPRQAFAANYAWARQNGWRV